MGRRPEEQRAETQDSTTNDVVRSLPVERLLMEARAWKARLESHFDYWLRDPSVWSLHLSMPPFFHVSVIRFITCPMPVLAPQRNVQAGSPEAVPRAVLP